MWLHVRMAMRKGKLTLVVLLTLILFTSFGLSAVSADSSGSDQWTIFRGSLTHSGLASGNSSASSFKLLWNYTTGAL